MTRWLLLILSVLIGANGPGSLAQPQCSARAPPLSLSAEFSPEELAVLTQILPKPTSDETHATRAELRAPLHIPCQMRAFPHVLAFHEQGIGRQLEQLKISVVAQPPHVVLFDASDRIVRAVPIAPAWTAFQLRDLIADATAGHVKQDMADVL